MTALILNIVFGLIPTFVLAGSIAAGIDDDRGHRKMFVFVYGLWAVTLAMWNWMRSYSLIWILVWLGAGVLAFFWIAWLSARSTGAGGDRSAE